MPASRFPLIELVAVAVLSALVALAFLSAFQPSTATTALTISNVAPADNSRVPARPLRISAEVRGERELQAITMQVNGLAVEPSLERLDPRRWRVAYTIERPTGEQVILLVARDLFGRQRNASVRVQVDPTLSIPAFSQLQPPEGGAAPAGGARLAAAIKSDSPIERVTLKVGGLEVALKPEPAGGAEVRAGATVNLNPGTYEAVLSAVDRDGDGNSQSWRIEVPDPKELLAFEQTGKTVGGGFRRFWEERGGLPIYGLPISGELREGSLTVQYFERARFEYHPRPDGLLSEVRLGLIAAELRKPDPPTPPTNAEGSLYFNETGHGLSGPVRRFWEEKGGLPIFGLPITGEVREGNLTVQYFERARLELHQGGDGPTVMIGHLGRELYTRRYPAPAPRTGA